MAQKKVKTEIFFKLINKTSGSGCILNMIMIHDDNGKTPWNPCIINSFKRCNRFLSTTCSHKTTSNSPLPTTSPNPHPQSPRWRNHLPPSSPPLFTSDRMSPKNLPRKLKRFPKCKNSERNPKISFSSRNKSGGVKSVWTTIRPTEASSRKICPPHNKSTNQTKRKN